MKKQEIDCNFVSPLFSPALACFSMVQPSPFPLHYTPPPPPQKKSPSFSEGFMLIELSIMPRLAYHFQDVNGCFLVSENILIYISYCDISLIFVGFI
jgi:hypothetical protein